MAAESSRIVFLGPSLPLDQATAILPDAEFRPPIRRDDLTAIPAGSIVGIIDGLLAKSLAISPGEIRDAIEHGVQVYGAASMGALRAAEVPAVIGVGHVYDMYLSGTIERDDEIASMLRADTFAALTEPLVNVRFAVDRLVRTGSLSRINGDAIVQAAANLHFSERTYPAILAASKLADKDVTGLITLLKCINLKADDARLLLETIAQAEPKPGLPSASPAASSPDQDGTKTGLRPIHQPLETLSLIPANQECSVCGDTPTFWATCEIDNPALITANTA